MSNYLGRLNIFSYNNQFCDPSFRPLLEPGILHKQIFEPSSLTLIGLKKPRRLRGSNKVSTTRESTLNTRIDGRLTFHVATSNPATEASSKRATETKGEETSDEGRPLRSFRSSSQVEESEMPTLRLCHGLPWWKCAEMGLRLVQFY